MNQTPKLTTVEEDLRGELERLSRLYPEWLPHPQIHGTIDNMALAASRGADGFRGIVESIISMLINANRKQSSTEEVGLVLFLMISSVYIASKNDEQAKNKGRVILAS